ncbi:hypothetical protein BC835DRAFT_450413 [Cytidiella melzeri]|nr:hypothetical protein BC835DRAFT_450413 [Cytidiella melzeri]
MLSMRNGHRRVAIIRNEDGVTIEKSKFLVTRLPSIYSVTLLVSSILSFLSLICLPVGFSRPKSRVCAYAIIHAVPVLPLLFSCSTGYSGAEPSTGAARVKNASISLMKMVEEGLKTVRSNQTLAATYTSFGRWREYTYLPTSLSVVNVRLGKHNTLRAFGPVARDRSCVPCISGLGDDRIFASMQVLIVSCCRRSVCPPHWLTTLCAVSTCCTVCALPGEISSILFPGCALIDVTGSRHTSIPYPSRYTKLAKSQYTSAHRRGYIHNQAHAQTCIVPS